VVGREAQAAAAALTRLTPHPSGLPAWQAYHGAFIERYGPRALVRLQEVVNPDTGLGFPATFQGSARTLPAPSSSGRDDRLLALAYRTVLDGGEEIVLDDQRIRDLAGTASEPAQVAPHAELFVQLHAASAAAVQRGAFRLLVTGASRAAGTTTGRFLDLFSATDKDRMTRAYAGLSTVRAGALPVQVSCPPVYAQSEAVARAPAVLPHLISAADHRSPGSGVIPLEDLAVSGDADGLYLVWLSRQQIVEPTVLNAVEFRTFSHPLTRFLAEITRARAAVYMPFTWDAAASLPFLPRLRFGRTVLAPAQWNLTTDDLPAPSASWPQWHDAVAAWRRRYRVPAAVHLAETDNLLRLDLRQSMHRALLRAHLNRRGHANLHQAPGPDAYGWLGGHAHEICVPLTSTVPALPAPPAAQLTRSRVIGSDHGHVPGHSRWLYMKVYGHPDRHNDILARIPDLLAAWEQPLSWWFVRYLDPDPHLRLRLHLPTADGYGAAARHVGVWLAGLRTAGLAAHMEFSTYYPETGRYGTGPAMAAAESVFAADSAAALAQISCTACSSTSPDPLTAASLGNIAAALTGTPAAGMRWLASNIPSAPAQIPRLVHDQAMLLADPQTGPVAAQALPGGQQILTYWQQRAAALAAYRDALAEAGEISVDSVLASLLHMHVIRVMGIDPETERRCHHLARSAAVGWLARNERTRP
jgi:thiopeptide-type bacteriocin biosynthesis protein